MAPDEVALYRFFDTDGALLYVGISDQPMRRWYNHTERKWWPTVASFEVTWYASRDEAEEAERESIRTEEPRHNVYGTKRYRELVRAGSLAAHARRRDFVRGKARHTSE